MEIVRDSDRRLTTVEDWNSAYIREPRMRYASSLVVTTRNVYRVFKQYARPGMRVVEFGFAPGKHLAFLAGKLGCDVTGVDYSARGVEVGKKLFASLGINGDLRCEDAFATTVEYNSFDLAYSIGLIEHFADPAALVEIHCRCLRPGGRGLIIVPNYRAWYGKVQRRLDATNLAIHNLDIMTREAMIRLAPQGLADNVVCTREGRFDLSLLSLNKLLPTALARTIGAAANTLGLLQPVRVGVLAPWLVMTFVRT